MKITALKRSTKPMRRTKLRVVGHSSVSELKQDIQALLREIVMRRDGGCVLRNYPETGKCGGYRKDGKLVLQAEHLHTRSNASSFSDPRLVICLCKRHHIYYKPQHADEYYRVVRDIIGVQRSKLLDMVQNDFSPHKVDLQLAKIYLEQELRLKYGNST